MTLTIPQLNERFAIPGTAEITQGNGGLPRVSVSHFGTEAEMYLHGGHIARWRDVIFLSNHSHFRPDKAIRGGVPICFPWFGPNRTDPSAPQHGFARQRDWELESVQQAGDAVEVVMLLPGDNGEFELRHRVRFGHELTMALELKNTGAANFAAEEAQHTYFQAGDVRQIEVHGLEALHYFDKVSGVENKLQRGPVLIAGEVDRIYRNSLAPITISDPVLNRRITISKSGSNDTVVWNPWSEKARALTDLGDDEWQNMVCVESCNLAPNAVTLKPGETHTMTTTISVSSL
jgi:glucose-6-phosphate 1-epimerase